MDRSLIERYAAQGPLLAALLDGLAPADLDARPGPGAWSLRELALHVCDSDLVGGDRMRRVACMPQPLLVGYDENAFVGTLYGPELDLALAARVFDDHRQLVAQTLRRLPDAALLRTGVHNESGLLTLAGLVEKYIKHVDGHFDFARRKRANLGKPLAEYAARRREFPMEIVGRETAYRGERWNVVAHTLRNARGALLRREFLEHPGAAVMLPMLPDGRVALIRNFRHVVPATLLELPAGTAASGEPFRETARRELAEETGYVAGRISPLLEFYPSPGPTSERMGLFVCWELHPGPPRPEADEEIAVVPMPFDAALAATRDGTIVDAKSLIGLWHAEHLRRTLGPRWWETLPHAA